MHHRVATVLTRPLQPLPLRAGHREAARKTSGENTRAESIFQSNFPVHAGITRGVCEVCARLRTLHRVTVISDQTRSSPEPRLDRSGGGWPEVGAALMTGLSTNSTEHTSGPLSPQGARSNSSMMMLFGAEVTRMCRGTNRVTWGPRTGQYRPRLKPLIHTWPWRQREKEKTVRPSGTDRTAAAEAEVSPRRHSLAMDKTLASTPC